MDFTGLRKLEKGSLPAKETQPDERLTGIIKVRRDGYRPACVRVRSTMDDRLFTADFLARDLRAIENDPEVERVAVSQTLPLQKLPSDSEIDSKG